MRYTPTAALRIAVALGCIPASSARGQQGAAVVVVPKPLVAIAHHDLTFGEVLPGIATSIRTDDVGHAAQFEIQGDVNCPVRVEFLLPSSLVSIAGSQLPLAFVPGDGKTDLGFKHHGISFDPRVPLIASLGSDGKLYIKLGGTVTPNIGQPGGMYSATISITVFDLGT
jgi:hypothetical protein